MLDDHKFMITAVHRHDAESAILVLKQGVTSVSSDFLQEHAAQSEIFVAMLTQHIS